MVLLGETFPNFAGETNEGPINFHQWLNFSWAILFSHPYDFTPICTTELARVVQLMPELKRLGVKPIGISCNSVESHKRWIEDIKEYAGQSGTDGFPYPIIEDESKSIVTQLGMLDPNESDKDGSAMPARAVYVIDPKKKMRLSILYPATTGRNFNEIIRAIESLQLSDAFKVGTPADWKKGEDVMIHPSVSDEQAKKMWKDIRVAPVPSGKAYMRFVKYPASATTTK